MSAVTNEIVRALADGFGAPRYKLLLEMQQEAVSALRPGAPLLSAYSAAMNRLQSKAAHLEKKLVAAVVVPARAWSKQSR